VIVTTVTPHLPMTGPLGFQPMPADFYFGLALLFSAKILTAEVVKSMFYRHHVGAQSGAP
jgi:hypothetical protein